MTWYTRRIQQIGNTVLVSLPKEWADANGLSKGDEVRMEAGQNTLSIGGEARRVKDVTISYPLPEEENIVANVTGAYLLGYDLIRVKSAKSIPVLDRQKIRDSVRRLAGMEIVGEDASTITAQFLLDASTLSPPGMLRRMSATVLGMFGDVLDALVSADRANLGTLSGRDDEVNRQYFLLVRLIRNAITDRRLADAFNLESIDVMDYRIAANILEETGDATVELAAALQDTALGDGELRRIYSVARDLPRMERLCIDAFVDSNRRLAIDAIAMHRSIQEAISSLRDPLQDRSRVSIDFLDMLYAFDRIERSWADIADLVKPVYR